MNQRYGTIILEGKEVEYGEEADQKCGEGAAGEFICINKGWGIGEGLCGKALKLGKENCLLLEG
jgi:hypothetical protein